MGWEELIDALDELETEVEYDGYFCSIRDVAIIVTLGSMCEQKGVMRLNAWATTETVSKFLVLRESIRINIPRNPFVPYYVQLPYELSSCIDRVRQKLISVTFLTIPLDFLFQ